jgi:hypothetical protein
MAEEVEPLVISDGKSSVTLFRPDRFPLHGMTHRVAITAGPFHGSFLANAYDVPWESFRRDLKLLSSTLHGSIGFGGYEELELIFLGDGLGHINVKVEIREYPIYLKFEIEIDQTHLPNIIAGIDRVFL